MTFRPYAWKIRLGNTENFLDIDDLTDGYLLWRNGSKVTSTLIDQGKLSLSTPQNPNDAATKQYVDDNLTADESARVAADIHLQAQIDALLGTSLTSGDKGDITITADGYGWTIDAGAVTNAKLAAVASGIIKGRASTGTGAVEDLTGTQATALLDVFSTEAKGLVPAAASGGTTNFLRADGVWAAPPAGTVTGVSVVSANGLAGTVANSGTTPAITLSTSVSGVLKGNGTAISAAISGTDYAPATSGTGILSGNGSGGFSGVAVGTGLSFAAGTLSNSQVGLTDGDKGDITVASSGTSWTVDANAISNTKLADMATATIKGRASAGSGDPEDLTAAQATALLNNFTSTLKGLTPASGGGTANFLRADGTWAAPPVTDGDKGDITVASSGTSWTIDSGAVSNAKLANVATATFKGRATAGTGSVEDLTGTQATALLDVFTTTAKGLVPVATGGGTTNFLRADGTWAAPPAGTVTSVSVVSANGLAGTVANATTTPAITLSTSITGLLQGNGTAISAATIGTGLSFTGGTLSNTQVGLTDGDKGDITVASSGASWTIDSGAVTNAKLANVATATFKGRTTAGTGAVEDLTATQATALLNNFTSTLKGLTPASGGGTTNYLRADGTWAAPPGATSGTVTSVSVASANGFAGTVATSASTPAITLSTSITGVLKGNGTAISAAVSGTDYAPATSGSSILAGNGSGGFSNISVGSGLSLAGGVLAATASDTSVISVTEGSAPSAAAGTGKLWANGAADARPYWVDDTGQSFNLTLDRFNTLTPAASVAIDVSPALPIFNSLTLNQNTAFTTSNLGHGRSASVRVICDGTNRQLTFPGTWKWLGSGPPSGLLANNVGYLSIVSFGSTDASVIAAWSYENMAQPGTVTGVSVVSANGLAGTVANSGTTPAITLSTSVTGLLKGSGGSISAAISGTDYAAPGNYVTTDTVQTITETKAIDVSSSSAALRVTQRGAGEALRVEDSTNPDSTPFVITADGSLGIGTSSPGAMLDVTATGASSVTTYSAEFESSSGTANAGRVLFSQGSTYAMAIAPAGTSGATGRIDFQYITRSTGAIASTPLSLRGDGNVGIGTTSPGKKLHINGSGLLIDGSNSIESSPLAARLIVDSGASTGHALADLRNSNGSVLLVGGSTVGIGTSSPSASSRLTISASTNDSLASIAISNTHISTGTWEIAVPASTKVLDFAYNGSTRGYLSNSVNQGIIDFTGQHRSVPTDIGQLENGGIGLIVVAAGSYQSLSGTSSIDINEALPRVTLSSARNQKSVFGVISDKEDGDSPTREYWVGNFVNVYDKPPGDDRLIINSLGEGAIWVCNINGNLENGDFITSCEVPGYGMRQDDDLLHNYTVAKITCDCDFDLSSTTYICQEFEFNGTVYRKAFVGCTYHCG